MKFVDLWKLQNNESIKFRLIEDQIKFKRFHSLSSNNQKHMIDCRGNCPICEYYKELTNVDPLKNSPFRVITHAYLNIAVDNESVVLVANKRKYEQIIKLVTSDINYFDHVIKITKQTSDKGFNEYLIEFNGYNDDPLPKPIDINIDESKYTRAEVIDILINSDHFVSIDFVCK